MGMRSTRKQIKVAFLGHPGFCLAPELHAEVDLAANTSALPPFPLISQPKCGGDGRQCLPTIREELLALLHLLLCPAGEDRDYSLVVCASFSSAAAVPC